MGREWNGWGDDDDLDLSAWDTVADSDEFDGDTVDDIDAIDDAATIVQTARTRAVMPAIDKHDLVAWEDATKAPTIVPGSGVSMGTPFIKRRTRPLTLRLVLLMAMGCLLLTTILAVSPLGNSVTGSFVELQALSGGAIWNRSADYVWYTAAWGDTIDSIAKKFKVQIGGIYELNNLYEGEEVQIGTAYKIPTNPTYGKSYHPPSFFTGPGADWSGKRYGPNWWNSMAGSQPADALCGPNGNGKPLDYQLKSPNWNSRWVRGYIVYGTWVYHTGVDLAAPEGNPIHAAQTGQVIWAGYDATNGLGYSVKIDHCNHISTVYGHMEKLLVKVGQNVQVGEVIGLEGSTGNSTGPHLHFMVEWDNLWTDPMPYYNNSHNNFTHYVG